MLHKLVITGYRLIRFVELTFGPGLTVITGETGSGKSLLFGAIEFLLGGKADPTVIHPEMDKVEVEAIIDGLGEKCLHLSRSWQRDGKSRCFLNHQPTTTTVLKKVRQEAFDFQKPENRWNIDFLQFIDASLQPMLEETRLAFLAWQAAVQQVQTLRQEKDNLAEKKAALAAIMADYTALNPGEQEETHLLQAKRRLQEQGALYTFFEEALPLLNGPQGISDKIYGLQKLVSRAGRFLAEPIQQKMAQCLQTMASESQELEALVQEEKYRLEEMPYSLDAIEARLHLFYTFRRRFNLAPDADIDSFYQHACAEEAHLEDIDQALEEACRKEDSAARAYQEAAQALTHQRQLRSQHIAAEVGRLLHQLHFPYAVFDIHVTPGDVWREDGWDRVSFLGSFNPVMPPAPVQKVASEGEFSRLLLALKIATGVGLQTQFFDEADMGTGGAAATAIGHLLHQLSCVHQVVAITHSPQVAACADQHVCIRKDAQTLTVFPLTQEERVYEVARMLSGASVTPEALAAAQRLFAS